MSILVKLRAMIKILSTYLHKKENKTCSFNFVMVVFSSLLFTFFIFQKKTEYLLRINIKLIFVYFKINRRINHFEYQTNSTRSSSLHEKYNHYVSTYYFLFTESVLKRIEPKILMHKIKLHALKINK